MSDLFWWACFILDVYAFYCFLMWYLGFDLEWYFPPPMQQRHDQQRTTTDGEPRATPGTSRPGPRFTFGTAQYTRTSGADPWSGSLSNNSGIISYVNDNTFISDDVSPESFEALRSTGLLNGNNGVTIYRNGINNSVSISGTGGISINRNNNGNNLSIGGPGDIAINRNNSGNSLSIGGPEGISICQNNGNSISIGAGAGRRISKKVWEALEEAGLIDEDGNFDGELLKELVESKKKMDRASDTEEQKERGDGGSGIQLQD